MSGLWKDTMTPTQRLGAYARGEAIDRLPCVPIVGNTAARVIGVKVSEIRSNARLLADAQIAAWKRFGYDGIRVFTDLFVQAEAMGAKVHVPLDETAYLQGPAINDISEIDRLRPTNPRTDGLLPVNLEAMRRTLDAIGSEVPVTGALTGPFTNASFLIGAENLARMTLRNPDAVHRLCQISLEGCLAYADAIIDTGATPSLTDAMSSCAVISPKQFATFSFPYLKQLVDHIHSRGKTVMLHICGETRRIWELMTDTGADCLSLDNAADLEEAKRLVGHRTRLLGNVPPSEVMLIGQPSDVRTAVRACVKKAHDNPKGYVVASGCSLATETPFANIDAMLDAVREIGWPVDASKL